MRIIIYQLLPRLFGNDNASCKPNGTLAENGCGKLNQITKKTLQEIKKLGVTHVWYTGLIEHATQTDYFWAGIEREHPAMVKGKAGSPYAIKDYYDIDPDLASSPERRFMEFQNLVKRTHQAGLQFVMDFVPNHVARQYHSDAQPEGTIALGANDKTDWAFSAQNNFYYIPYQSLACQFDMKGDADTAYQENPARVTGNDCFSPCPSRNDWYETVKLNYGVDYQGGRAEHFFPVPDTWYKMRNILAFWTEQGVDAFRCDMAEMVPCAFWHWVIPQIKMIRPVDFIGEVYNPSLYRDYINYGHFDYLYDKVGLYDTLKEITRGTLPASAITNCWQSVGDIQTHMLNFLENHDEQRIASPFFANQAERAKSALLVSVCLSTNPFMLYFGQELGERGMDSEGFSGTDGRTTIFDYWSVDTIRRWRNKGKYDGKLLTETEKDLQSFYERVLQLAQSKSALYEGEFFDLMYVNYRHAEFDPGKTFAFIRSSETEKILVVANFSDYTVKQSVKVPQHAFDYLHLTIGEYVGIDLLTQQTCPIHLFPDEKFVVNLPANSGVLIKLEKLE